MLSGEHLRLSEPLVLPPGSIMHSCFIEMLTPRAKIVAERGYLTCGIFRGERVAVSMNPNDRSAFVHFSGAPGPMVYIIGCTFAEGVT